MTLDEFINKVDGTKGRVFAKNASNEFDAKEKAFFVFTGNYIWQPK